jgi:hypothetical protein
MAEDNMTHHFSLGEHVIFSEKGLSGVTWFGEYEINGLLAGNDGNPQYQLACVDQSHHRVVDEREIRALTAADRLNVSASLQLEEVHPPRLQRPMLTDPALLDW